MPMLVVGGLLGGNLITGGLLAGSAPSDPLAAGTASFVSSGPAGIAVSATDAADGVPPYTYQWQRNADGGSYANLSGATARTLTDATATTTGVLYGYRLVYTDDDADTDTSNAVTAEVYAGGALATGGSGGVTEDDIAAIAASVLAGIPAALDDVMVESNVNLRQGVSSILAAATGVGPGVVSGVATLKNPAGTATRIVAAAAGGNRTTVTLTPYEP